MTRPRKEALDWSCPHAFWGMRVYLCSSHQRSNRRFCPVCKRAICRDFARMHTGSCGPLPAHFG